MFFTLIELLVVISIISVLMSILLPVIQSAMEEGRRIRCLSNVRQLGTANISYADDNGAFVFSGDYMGNMSRWHGVRDSYTDPFDFKRSDLRPYMEDGIKECPSFLDVLKADDWDSSYEKGCGGYGYSSYVGGSGGMGEQPTAKPQDLYDPANTIMFCDTASTKSVNSKKKLIEYSAATAPWYIYSSWGMCITSTPNCHFRHSRSNACNVNWSDGHATSTREVFYRDGTEPDGKKFNIGYIGRKMLGGSPAFYGEIPSEVLIEQRYYDLCE